MKLLADIGGEKHEVRLHVEGSRVVAEIDGRTVEASVQETERGGYLLIIEGRVYDCRASEGGAQGEGTTVRVRSSLYSVAVSDPKRLRAAKGAAAHADGTAQIVAQMPGKVVRVHVSQGSQVEAGATILVVEAMKMQNEMKSPKAGVVSVLNAKVGETVNAGDLLAVIE